MTRSATLLLLLAAAGCSAGPSDPVEAGCRRQAYQDPAVEDLLERSNSQLQQVRAPALMEMNALVREKTRACMAANGVGPPGGVAPIKPY